MSTNKHSKISTAEIIKDYSKPIEPVNDIEPLKSNAKTDLSKTKTDSRPSKTDYYLNIARQVSLRSTCLRRNFGAVIVKDDHIVSTGYNGAPRGVANCMDLGICPRQKAGIPAGERYELCRSVHAEANAIIQASASDMRGSTLYLCSISKDDGTVYGGRPCKMCTRIIMNAGIKTVIVKEKDNLHTTYDVERWISEDDPDVTKTMNGY
jgi:dCMP deaminase